MSIRPAVIRTYLEAWRLTDQIETKAIELARKGAQTLLDSEIRQLLRRLEYLLEPVGSNSKHIRFEPFDDMQSLYNVFADFTNRIGSYSGDTVELDKLWKEFDRIIVQFKEVFEREVQPRDVFVCSGRKRFIDCLTPKNLLSEPTEHRLFDNHLPIIARKNFEDAGKCVAVGISSPAISLSLQAVEATLRYYYLRHGGPRISERNRPPMWHDFVTWLWDRKELPSESLRNDLIALKDDYRNVVAHGIPLIMKNVSSEAYRILDKCLQVALALVAELEKKPQRKIKIILAQDFDFDTALAAFLFKWNPEHPEIPSESFELAEDLAPGELIDETINHRETRIGEGNSLCNRIAEYLQIQPSYHNALTPLLQFADELTKGRVESQVEHGKDNTANLADLFFGIKYRYRGLPSSALKEVHSLFENFLIIVPDNYRIVNELEMQDAFEAFCELKRKWELKYHPDTLKHYRDIDLNNL